MARYVFGRNAVMGSLANEGKKATRLHVLKMGKEAEDAVATAKSLKIKVEVKDCC